MKLVIPWSKLDEGLQEQRERVSRINRLATFNAEVARGLVHTDDWRGFMRREQEWFDNPFSSAHNTESSRDE